jgi:hypothetical protein
MWQFLVQNIWFLFQTPSHYLTISHPAQFWHRCTYLSIAWVSTKPFHHLRNWKPSFTSILSGGPIGEWPVLELAAQRQDLPARVWQVRRRITHRRPRGDPDPGDGRRVGSQMGSRDPPCRGARGRPTTGGGWRQGSISWNSISAEIFSDKFSSWFDRWNVRRKLQIKIIWH